MKFAVEKGLIAFLFVLAGYQVNSSLERYKLIEAQRAADTSEFVKACSDLWTKACDYEDGINEIDQLKSRRWLLKALDKKTDTEIDIEIAQRQVKNEEQLIALKRAVRERRYVIGESMTVHFWRYVGFLQFRANAQESWRSDTSPSVKDNSYQLVEEVNRQLATMRFSANAAREHAISRLP